jgi:hypothetical protein
MPDQRAHRGADSHDARDFAPEALPGLRAGVHDYSWLLERRYAEPSALKVVGDRYLLTARQRVAVRRSACADTALALRLAHQVEVSAMHGQPLWLDGFNVLMTIEAALGGAAILVGRDGCLRDLMGVHGTYRRVEETLPALDLLATFLDAAGIGPCTWYLDRPVSNSGRLRELILQTAAARGLTWSVELAFSPDPILAAATVAIATADAIILDRCARWVNLARAVVQTAVPTARVVDFVSSQAD